VSTGIGARVLHHGRCFDGALSAALAVRLLRLHEGIAHIETRGLAHRAGSPYDANTFSAPTNVVVDFRYASHPGLRWWFDHHASTFLSDADRAHFEADRSGRKFFDPAAPSCAGLMQREVSRRLGLDLTPDDAELIHWADMVDAAQFADAATAVRLEEPALGLMTWLEAAADPAEEQRFVAALADGGRLGELVERPWIRRGLDPALEQHQRCISLVTERMRVTKNVAYVDLADVPLRGLNKFIPYHLDPSLVYVVMVLQLPDKTKVSVGSNPWLPERRTVDIGALCNELSGGGHATVGAIALSRGETKKAREIAEIVTERLITSS
jgi:hypothetical protein